MFSTKLFTALSLYKHLKICANTVYSVPKNIQVSIIGATNDVGSNLALLLKQNHKIQKVQLYDDDSKVKGIGLELNHIPGGPEVTAFAGDNELNAAVRKSNLIVMVHRVPRKPGFTREQMIAANAPAVQRMCRAVANHNPEAFIAIATNPINSMVPFASALMYKYGSYNPFKIFGVTHIDTARARMFASNAFRINPLDVFVPVIGGHSDETIVPLFSNMVPNPVTMDPYIADSLTRLVRKAGTEVIFRKQGRESATLAMATSINEFINLMVEAIRGQEIVVNSFTANPNFGTRFFSGPTRVGRCGILQACHNFPLNDSESSLLNSSLPVINRDVALGEGYVQFLEMIEKY